MNELINFILVIFGVAGTIAFVAYLIIKSVDRKAAKKAKDELNEKIANRVVASALDAPTKKK
jgi:hypothetical protein